MKKGDIRLKNGFTILEVTLVLAIAGLIFLMIFFALPTLQRTERDSERKEDVTRLLDEIKKFQTKNRGALPESPSGESSIVVDWKTIPENPSMTSWEGFYKEYLGERFVNPMGNKYLLGVVNCDGQVVDGECGNNVKEIINTLNDGQFAETTPIYVVVQAKCAGDMETGVVANSNARNVAVVVQLEGPGLYCASS